MKKYYTDIENTVFFDAPMFNRSEYTVTVSLRGEDGTALKKSNGDALTNAACTFDTDKNKYKFTVLFLSTTKAQYARIYWRVTKSSVAQDIPEEYDPEEIQLKTLSDTSSQQIVPIQYFQDYVISAAQKMDDELTEAVRAYPREGLQTFLLAAQGDVENMINMTFFLTEYEDKKDYTWDNLFGDTFWLQQVYNRPLKEIVSFELYHGATKIIEIPKEDVLIEEKHGTAEYVPTSSSGGLLFQSLMASGDGVKLAVIGRGSASRLPLAWRLKYKAGLDFPNLSVAKKENFRYGVARHALIELLPHIDPSTRVTSQSESMDGVSMSSSKSIDSIIKQLRESEANWLNNVRKEYATTIDMVIV